MQQRADRPGRALPADVLSLVHELEVHQIELELQNAELRRAQEELAAAHARYFELFDLAPMGYLTLDGEGQILEANLEAASLFGRARSELAGQPLTRFIWREDQDLYYLHRKRVAGAPGAEVCELRLNRRADEPRWVRLQSVLAPEGGRAAGRQFRVTLSDITERKLAEQTNRVLARRLIETQEEERRVLARELHDSAGQTLTSMFLELGALAREIAVNSDIAARFAQLLRNVEGLMSELHSLSANLHPAALERSGLLGALQGLLERSQSPDGPQLDLQAWGLGDRRLLPTQEIVVYRVAQEAITNALRHAQASNIGIVVQLHDNRLQVTIEDDGIGFNVEAARAKGRGLGLLNMRERTEMLDGSLTIESRPGGGTTVYVQLPL
ncbi:MAG TPA: ATP-binding protein [Anaerolineae bacterium]